MKIPSSLARPNKGKPDYTCMEEVTTEVVTITELPGGHGQKAQPLVEPIELVKTKLVDVGDELQPREILPTRMITHAEAAEMMKAGGFTKSMIPNKRVCRSCDEELPRDRHWNCRKCVPVLPEDSGEYGYCGVSGE